MLSFQIEQLTVDLSSERSTAQSLESEHILLERQNKELKAKLSELDVLVKSKNKASMQSLETQIKNLEEQLEAETKSVEDFSKFPNLDSCIKIVFYYYSCYFQCHSSWLLTHFFNCIIQLILLPEKGRMLRN